MLIFSQYSALPHQKDTIYRIQQWNVRKHKTIYVFREGCVVCRFCYIFPIALEVDVRYFLNAVSTFGGNGFPSLALGAPFLVVCLSLSVSYHIRFTTRRMNTSPNTAADILFSTAFTPFIFLSTLPPSGDMTYYASNDFTRFTTS